VRRSPTVASLRDVLNHAGKKVRIVDARGATREGLAMRRGDVALLEPKLAPMAGEILEFVESSERFRLESAEPQDALGKIDHYRSRIVPAPRG
jgi:hypothetical protein